MFLQGLQFKYLKKEFSQTILPFLPQTNTPMDHSLWSIGYGFIILINLPERNDSVGKILCC